MTAVSPERVRGQIDQLAVAGLDWQTFGRTATDLLNRAMPFAASCFASVDPATHIVTANVKSGCLDDDHDIEWSYHEYEVEDLYDFRSLSSAGGGVVTLHSSSGGDLERSRRHAELFAPVWDFSDELRVTLRVDGVTWGALALFHGDGRTFTTAEQAFVASVSEGLARGVRSGLVAAAVGDDGRPAPSGPAVLVVDASGEVAQANLGATERLADLGCADLEASELPQIVKALVAAARRMSTTPGASTPRARMRTDGGHWIVAHASPLISRDGGRPDVVVTIDDARPPEIVPLVVASYGLTGRERDVVALVLQGIDTGDIAQRLHLSAYTVQDHLKKVFAKVGVRSRRELIAQVFNDHYVPQMAAGAGLAPSGWFAGS
ncbi:LuxR C-terminal-related transcriptional regulator [Actinomycetospora corticicola]|uniref:DNA-binding CsgD family transcriptional regulator n=1 Tax=Actinomycetospora corticicola TaxID=663602 RepID=A0A7Y9DX59_9PSEU|nr:helix-turn-helix transcriptional regulator [Actinomycetospora corticicola]NYD37152.1 DNA-binding CsgD family transcriptional regulator [Actinomycetospora corticicola]